MEINKLYHVTTKENAEKILKEGLIPQIGEHSKAVYECDEYIYLCDHKSIKFWKILMNCDVVLEIDMKGIEDNIIDTVGYGYDDYYEYIVEEPIKAERISLFTDKITQEKAAMRKLCELYIIDISRTIANEIIRPYSRHEVYNTMLKDEDIKYIKEMLSSLLYSLHNLKYSILTDKNKEHIRQMLTKEGDSGEYTLFDRYFDEDKKLWQKMIEFPKDETYELRKELYDFIDKNLAFCHDLETGGFCY